MAHSPPGNLFLLLDEEATAKNIRSVIGTKIPKRAGEQDMVYIYYAGHGSPVMDPKNRSRDGMEKNILPTDVERSHGVDGA
ncbi:MAG: caspase family protein [candidate division KSB1 bacterium]|nr:caspase family protein [candidate division KSB1 bacterium]MDZ7304722.1 caspase family protein [candidate division KSB1 bacterium]MDZ7312778.1 caspase family protein [candidate division KSB1 bacterium]